MNHSTYPVSRKRQLQSSLLTVGVSAVVTFCVFKLWEWIRNQKQQIPQSQRNDASLIVHDQLRHERRLRSKMETLKALQGLLPSLRRLIESHTNARDETNALREIRAKKQDMDGALREREAQLWSVLQTKILTRLFVTVYAYTILFLVLTVQVNVLGGALLEEQLRDEWLENEEPGSCTSCYQSAHRLVLTSTYDYFFETGIAALVSHVEAIVEAALEDWHMTVRVTEAEVASKMAAMRGSIERLDLLQLVIPPSPQDMETLEDGPLATRMLDEMWDVLESPCMQDAQQSCLALTFDTIRQHHWSSAKAVASVIPRCKVAAASLYEEQAYLGNKTYAAKMETLRFVQELAAVSFK